MEGKFG